MFLFRVFILCLAASVGAAGFAAAGTVPVRNYLTGMTLDSRSFEVSLDLLQMNETIDLFDFRDSRIDDVNVSSGTNTLGDLRGGRLMASYGLSDSVMVTSRYAYRQLDVSIYDYEIDSYELGLTKRFGSGPGTGGYSFLSIGCRYDVAGDYRTADIDEINQLVRRINSDLSVTSRPGRVELSDGNITISSPLVNSDGTLKDPLTVNLHDNYDYTFYIRSGIGTSWRNITLSLFGEFGYSEIRGSLGQNFALYGVDDTVAGLADYDPGFDRNETYGKAGIDIQVRPFADCFANFIYYYQLMTRDSDLDYIDYNHILQGELVYRFNELVAVNLGAEYFYRQFNGAIPLLYNEYTQTTFDHDYAVVHGGLTFTFDL
ncbi:MAG: hypothetical protein RQ754_10370 [Desulfuromonadales bacterium]|nr:hypothetical protein [Desulfuromonadales bacterium]